MSGSMTGWGRNAVMTVGLLILRLVVGLGLAAHGCQKLFGWFGGGGIAGTGAFFENHLRLRPGRVHATLAGLTELGGGLGLVLGLLTPVAAAAVVGVMLVAGASAHRGKGFFVTQGGFEYTLVLGAVGAALAYTGPGRASIDHALGWDLNGFVWGTVATLFGIVAGLCLLAGRTRLVEGDTAVAGGREAGLERSESASHAAPPPETASASDTGSQAAGR
ncbi:MAG: putative oxidoreductase [Acidimicrobiaceae bacterium]|nr:putative oxidoreductase [Acidimicrobiaceae bacterium]